LSIKILLLSTTLLSFLHAVNLEVCTGCHGDKFEKSALGESKVVAKMSEREIITALEGYKNGSYGGTLRGIMESQVSAIEDSNQSAVDILDYALGRTRLSKDRDSFMLTLELGLECARAAKNRKQLNSCNSKVRETLLK